MSNISTHSDSVVDGRHTADHTRTMDFTETKAGIKTSEFAVMAVFVVAALAATYLDGDSLSRDDGWRFASYAIVAYILSRGLAKLGVRARQGDNTRN